METESSVHYVVGFLGGGGVLVLVFDFFFHQRPSDGK